MNVEHCLKAHLSLFAVQIFYYDTEGQCCNTTLNGVELGMHSCCWDKQTDVLPPLLYCCCFIHCPLHSGMKLDGKCPPFCLGSGSTFFPFHVHSERCLPPCAIPCEGFCTACKNVTRTESVNILGRSGDCSVCDEQRLALPLLPSTWINNFLINGRWYRANWAAIAAAFSAGTSFAESHNSKFTDHMYKLLNLSALTVAI